MIFIVRRRLFKIINIDIYIEVFVYKLHCPHAQVLENVDCDTARSCRWSQVALQNFMMECW